MRTSTAELLAIYAAAISAPVVPKAAIVELSGLPEQLGSFVYFARAPFDVKVGFSLDPVERVQSMGLSLTLVIEGATRTHELAIHRLFDAERTRRSEFFAGPAVELFLARARLAATTTVGDTWIGGRLRERVAQLKGEVAERIIGARVKSLRESLGLKQRELATRAGLSSGYLSQLENDAGGANIRAPRPETITKLAAALGVTAAHLAFGSEAV